MSQNQRLGLDYAQKYKILNGRVIFANYVQRRQMVNEGLLLGLNVFPPTNDASIIPRIKDGEVNTTPEELASYLGQQNIISVLTVPGAPTSVSATPGNTQATVSFTAPTSDGGSAITGYTVTSSPGGFTATGASSPLTVTGLTNGTAYTFTVVATNSIGNSVSSSASAPVTPATVPGSPISLSATFGNTQVTVSFSPPLSDGGSAITGYTVTASPGNFTATGASSPLTVTGLTNGTTYSFTAVATNIIGNSLPSPAIPGTPATVPDAPTSVSATAGNAQATISFTAPASDGGSAITGYTVTSSPGNFTATGASSPLTVTGLTNGTAYTFTVVATNSIGNSVASAASSPVTPNPPGDAIIASLTTSLAAYNAAANGDWVKITTTEYANLKTNVTGTIRAGTSDTYMASSSASGLTVSDQSALVANQVSANSLAVPANNYVYACSIIYAQNVPATDMRVYTNTNSTSYTGFNQIGTVLPATTSGVSGFATNCYVLKGVSTTNGATAGLFAVFTGQTASSATRIAFVTPILSGAPTLRYLLFTPGATGGSPTSSSVMSGSLANYSAFQIQALTTPTKQWA